MTHEYQDRHAISLRVVPARSAADSDILTAFQKTRISTLYTVPLLRRES